MLLARIEAAMRDVRTMMGSGFSSMKLEKLEKLKLSLGRIVWGKRKTAVFISRIRRGMIVACVHHWEIVA